MKIWVRRGLFIGAALALAGVAGLGTLWWAGNRQLTFDHGALPEPVAGGPGDAAHGGRLVKVYGCAGCHGEALTGEDFFGIPAPNLRRRAGQWSMEDFARAVRRGIRPDGTSISWAMPSEHFAVMADNEVSAIYAHLKTLPQAHDTATESWKVRLRKPVMAAMGELPPNALLVRASDANPAVAPRPAAAEWGPYFTRLACGECHNHGLGGYPGDTPALADVIQRYDWPAFARFTTTGITAEGQTVRMMSGVSRGRLVHMTDAERRALFDYLKSLPQPY